MGNLARKYGEVAEGDAGDDMLATSVARHARNQGNRLLGGKLLRSYSAVGPTGEDKSSGQP